MTGPDPGSPDHYRLAEELRTDRGRSMTCSSAPPRWTPRSRSPLLPGNDET